MNIAIAMAAVISPVAMLATATNASASTASTTGPFYIGEASGPLDLGGGSLATYDSEMASVNPNGRRIWEDNSPGGGSVLLHLGSANSITCIQAAPLNDKNAGFIVVGPCSGADGILWTEEADHGIKLRNNYWSRGTGKDTVLQCDGTPGDSCGVSFSPPQTGQYQRWNFRAAN